MHARTRLEIFCQNCYGAKSEEARATYRCHALDTTEKLLDEELDLLRKLEEDKVKGVRFIHDNEEIAKRYEVDDLLTDRRSVGGISLKDQFGEHCAEDCLTVFFSKAIEGCKSCEYKEPVLYELVGKLKLIPDKAIYVEISGSHKK